MDLISGGLALASFGANFLARSSERDSQREQVRAANRQTALQDQAAMQNWQYNDEMRKRQERIDAKLYEQKKKEYQFQKELNFQEYTDFYMDAQMAFDNLIRDTRLASMQSAAKLAQVIGQQDASALARGAVGGRAGVRQANSALWQGMEQANRMERLIFADSEMRENIVRGARDTNLRNQIAFNRVGPPPEALPQAPRPIPGQRLKQGSDFGFYAGLLGDGINALSTYNTLRGKNPVDGGDNLSSKGTPQWGGIPYALPGGNN